MGAWGNGPMDNDTALDFTGDGERQVTAADVAKLLDDVDNGWRDYATPEELRAAAYLVSQGEVESTPGWNINEFRRDLKQALTALAQNSDWIDAWNEPDEVRKLVLAEADAL